MKKLIFLFVLGCSLYATEMFAQPTFYFDPEIQIADCNEQVCVQVKTADFTDLLIVRFSLNWDPAVLDYTNIQNINPNMPNFNVLDFNTTMANQGKVGLSWEAGPPCNASLGGVTLDDDDILFEICFEAIGDYGDHTEVTIGDDPQERYVTRTNANCNDIGEFIPNTAWVSVKVHPMTIIASSANGNPGEVVCVDLTVEDFVDIISMQFSINWNPTILEFQDVEPFNLPAFSVINNININAANGEISVSWFDPSGQGQDLVNGTQIIQLCFTIIGDGGDLSPVTITDEPTVIEVTNINNFGQGIDISVFAQNGQVVVNSNTPGGLPLNIPEELVNVGESFCVPITAGPMDNVNQLDFSIGWNPSILDFDNIPNSSFTNDLFLFGNSNVSTSQSGQGLITVEWGNGTGLGSDIGANEVLFEMCFTAVGPGGSNSPLSVVNAPVPINVGVGNDNVGIASMNGLVTIAPSIGLTVKAGSDDADPGQQICIDITTQDFETITRMDYTVSWEPDILQFVSVTDFGLPNMDASNFNTSVVASGAIGVEWLDFGGTGETLPDGAVLYSLCFDVIGDPEDCSNITFSDLPFPSEIHNVSSNGNDIGLNGQPGQVCVTNPFTFFVNISDGLGSNGSTTCVDFSIDNFNQLTNLEFSVNWDIDFLEFVEIINPETLNNFTENSYDIDPLLLEDGIFTIDWNAQSPILGTSLDSGTVIFQACFNVLGPVLECSPIVISNNPEPIVVTSATTGPANIGLQATDGSICVTDVISINSVDIIPVDCPGSTGGAIDITVSGGSEEYNFFWTGPGIIEIFDEDQVNLTNANYTVTITDTNNPNLELVEVITVTVSPNAPFASAGVDTSFACGSFAITLDGSASSQGPDITYCWEPVNMGGVGLVIPGNENKMNPDVIGGSAYKITVKDANNNCQAMDTVLISSPIVPGIDIPTKDTILICNPDSVVISAQGSSSGDNFDFIWTTGPGGNIRTGDTTLTPTVDAPGVYYFELTHTGSGCSVTDSVTVIDERDVPIATAGADQSLDCDDDFVGLDGSGSTTGATIMYQWTALSGEICGMDDQPIIDACTAGMYELLVTNMDNACIAIDTVMVVGDTLKPLALAGMDQLLDCKIVTATLDGSASSQGSEFTYSWVAMNGGNITSATDIPIIDVDEPGTYVLTVVNTNNDCKSVSEVEVTEDVELPTAVVSNTGILTCAIEEINIDAAGTSAGDDFEYEWFFNGGSIPEDTLIFSVNAPGEYELIVTDTTNGCTATALTNVAQDIIDPPAEAGDIQTITCANDEVILEGATDGNNPNLVIQWSGPIGGGCITAGTGNSPTPTVSCEGEYTMTVLDESNGCSATDQVMVDTDLLAPEITATALGNLTCTVTCADLQVTIDNGITNYEVEWRDADTGSSVGTAETINVCSEGGYEVTATNLDNGCTSMAAFAAITSDTTPPIPVAQTLGDVDCVTTLATIDASGNDLTNVTIEWSAMPGTPPLDPTVINDVMLDVPEGDYLLTVTNIGNGCSETTSTAVINVATTVSASAAAPQAVGCLGNAVALEGTGSDVGENIVYIWTDVNGMMISNEINASSNIPGEYTLVVTDTSNQCTATASAIISEIMDGQAATAMADYENCTLDAGLIGNLPEAASGAWTALVSGNIAALDTNMTTVDALAPGENAFVWTLSFGNCVEYSSDTVYIEVDQTLPDARPDSKETDIGQTLTVSKDLLANDETFGLDVEFNLLSAPDIGTVDSIENGQIVYTAPPNFIGQVELLYSICSPDCPTFCDTTTVRFDFDREPIDFNEINIPNAITPNDDGVNDAFVIVEGIDFFYPKNEIVIFNRWGDIVYQQKPYMNEWRGTNESDKPLPEGTYYYILRLNLGQSEIIRGDITIMR